MDFDENIESGDLENQESEFLFGEDNAQFSNKRDSVLFVVDVTQSMLDPNPYNEGGASNLQTVIKAAIGFMKTKIITNQQDTLGIILYNSNKSENSMKFKHIQVL
jgi:hypothetical protein